MRRTVNQVISEATRRNWNRLNTGESSRLTKRANKRLSSKKIVPVEYFANKNNQKTVMEILAVLDDAKYTIMDVLCTIAENLFDGVGILHNANVQSVLAEYPYTRIESIFKSKMPTDERDLLGIVYQSSMMEGTKNQNGSYYTPHKVTSAMVAALTFDKGQTFIDPCCGSGAFLLSVSCDNPKQLYGIDSDPIAAMITKFNLLLHYPHEDFIPNVICGNFLLENPYSKHSFDYIVTNPPWGAFVGNTGDIAEITSQENPSEIIEDKDNKDNTSKKKLKSKFNLLEQGRLMIIGTSEEISKNLIIIGPKGSGKSSIFSLLTTGSVNNYSDSGTCGVNFGFMRSQSTSQKKVMNIFEIGSGIENIVLINTCLN